MSYLRFPVSHSMAPLSHLLVYYVRENGEGVTDSVQIPVQPDFENQVCLIPKLGHFSLTFCKRECVNAFFPLRYMRCCPRESLSQAVAMAPSVSTNTAVQIPHFGVNSSFCHHVSICVFLALIQRPVLERRKLRYVTIR